ncbi:tetratricopeptide repeat protein [Aquibacillus saliphilus]|uniref:tetratricopeptide repeat protein n=1 Tax=Aquibacillus saliphilus TaxID=1909422 RepID=UPI001CF09777|nr:hypothetical protein [Aquibacillus saliphilus]
MQTLEDTKTVNKTDNVTPFIPEGDFYFTKGVEAFQKRKFDIAIKWLKKAVEDSPKEALYHCQMSIVYTEIGAYHAANQILTEVLSENGDSYIDCYYLIANNYAHLGLLQDAKKYTKTYLDKAPNGDFTKEAEDLLTVLDIGDDDDDDEWAFEEEDELLIYQETAFYHLERQEWSQAITLLEEMMGVFPEHIAAKHEFSFALFFNGDQDEAIRLEEQWLKNDPQSLYCHTNLAIFYYERNDINKCNQHIVSLQNVYPIHEQQKLKIANTLARTGHYKEAYDRFKMLSKGHLKGHASYFKWYSACLYGIGASTKALSLWEEGCKKYPFLNKETSPW